jgi:hypothetical protein
MNTFKGTLAAIFVMILSGIPAGMEFPQNQAPDLAALLEKAAAYCRKLEGAALDYICKEEIVEVTDPRLDMSQSTTPLTTWTSVKPTADASTGLGETRTGIAIVPSPPKVKRTLIYDYQCIRAGGEIREVRNLLEENRKKINEPKAKLKTLNFLFGYVLMAPVGIFAERSQPEYDYRIVGKDKIQKRPVVIIDVTPKPDAPEAPNLYGKAWIDAATGDILKIQWSEKRVNHYEIALKRAEQYNRKPRLTIRSEFQVEKNGVRFPSKLFVEEAYVSEGGLVFVRSETNVTYKDFKFFTVETEPKIIR